MITFWTVATLVKQEVSVNFFLAFAERQFCLFDSAKARKKFTLTSCLTRVATVQKVIIKKIETASFMHKYLHGDLPETFKNLLDDNFLDGSNSRQTRSQCKLFPRFCRIE